MSGAAYGCLNCGKFPFQHRIHLGNSSFTAAKSPATYRFLWYVMYSNRPKDHHPWCIGNWNARTNDRQSRDKDTDLLWQFLQINGWVHDQKTSLQLSNAVSGMFPYKTGPCLSLPCWLLTVCIWTISRKNRLTHTVEPVSCLSCLWIKDEVSKSTERSKSHRFPSINSLASKTTRCTCVLCQVKSFEAATTFLEEPEMETPQLELLGSIMKGLQWLCLGVVFTVYI